METTGISLPSRRKFIKCGGLSLVALALPGFTELSKFNNMTDQKNYDAIIIGGSYSGLAAAMALGRALKRVLVIDGGMPCNRQTPYSHNFITQDGKTPKEITMLAKQQVKRYDTVEFFDGLAQKGIKTAAGFEIEAASGEKFRAGKIIFATGIRDIMPDIEGFSGCWGISVLHCPYCHGYEVRNQKTGILGNGEYGFEFSKMISNWTNDLTLYTNGRSTLSTEQTSKLEKHGIRIVEKEVAAFKHESGKIQKIVFKDGTNAQAAAIYTRTPFAQQCPVIQNLGCALTDEGYIQTDAFQKTTVEGVFACGDNVSRLRTVANAVAMGTAAGMFLNREIVFERF